MKLNNKGELDPIEAFLLMSVIGIMLAVAVSKCENKHGTYKEYPYIISYSGEGGTRFILTKEYPYIISYSGEGGTRFILTNGYCVRPCGVCIDPSDSKDGKDYQCLQNTSIRKLGDLEKPPDKKEEPANLSI